MAVQIITWEPGFREYRVNGNLTEDCIKLIREFNEFPEAERPGKVILDLSVMVDAPMSLGEIARSADFRFDDVNPPRMAIVAATKVLFGTVRQLVQYQGVAHRIRPFLDRDEAEAWLNGAG